MELWQVNAYYEAWEHRQADSLSQYIQSAYYAAYWNNSGKKGVSLKRVLDKIHPKRRKAANDKPVDVVAISKKFEQFEELKKNGWCRIG